MKLLDDRNGSVAMETVMILPVFVIIIFFILQISLVWGAKQMVSYAAYCGARAALVYNPADYDAEQAKDGHWATRSLEMGGSQRGVVHFAACTVLSWVSWTLADEPTLSLNSTVEGTVTDTLNQDFRLGMVTTVPLSSHIRSQVRVEVREFETIWEDGEKDSSNDSDEPTPIERQFPAVTVRVRFDFPLFIPLGGTILGYFYGAGETQVDTTGAIDMIGFTAPQGDTVHQYMKTTGHYMEPTDGWGVYSIPLEERCTMAKPYKTDTYPLMSSKERLLMGIF